MCEFLAVSRAAYYEWVRRLETPDLFPITLLSISVASFSLGPSIDRQLTIQRLEFIAPALGQLLGQNIDEIIEEGGPVTSVALVGLIWSASTVFTRLLTPSTKFGVLGNAARSGSGVDWP